jgi:hypothetical protein
MHDDEKPVRGGNRPEQDRHFEMPSVVREVHPDEREEPAPPAPPVPPIPPAPPSAPAKAGEHDGDGPPAPSELSARFARRWDQVQTAFVSFGAR